jgi:hypothetical protein
MPVDSERVWFGVTPSFGGLCEIPGLQCCLSHSYGVLVFLWHTDEAGRSHKPDGLGSSHLWSSVATKTRFSSLLVRRLRGSRQMTDFNHSTASCCLWRGQ